MTKEQEIEYLESLRDNFTAGMLEASADYDASFTMDCRAVFRAVIDAKIKEVKETK